MKNLLLLGVAAVAFSFAPIEVTQAYSDEMVVTAYKTFVYKF